MPTRSLRRIVANFASPTSVVVVVVVVVVGFFPLSTPFIFHHWIELKKCTKNAQIFEMIQRDNIRL